MLRFGGHIALSRWRPRALNTISGFAFVDIAAFRRSKSISKQILSTYLSWWLRYNYFRFLKNKRPPYWKYTFGFDFDHLPEICTLLCIRLPIFFQNRSTYCGNMTSYPFLKMAAATAEYYFRFHICWCHCLQKVKVYYQTKFCRDISNGGWDIFLWQFKMA